MRLVEALISALLVAGLYATMSYGLALIYGVMKIINLANAGIMMLGAFATWVLWQWIGLDPILSVIVVAPLGFILGALIEVFLVRRVSVQAPIVSLLLLFGVWLVMESGAYLIFGGETRGVVPVYVQAKFDVGGVIISVSRLAVFLAGIAILIWPKDNATGTAIVPVPTK